MTVVGKNYFEQRFRARAVPRPDGTWMLEVAIWQECDGQPTGRPLEMLYGPFESREAAVAHGHEVSAVAQGAVAEQATKLGLAPVFIDYKKRAEA